MAGYGTAIAIAQALSLDQVVSLLEETLEEEKAADLKLTQVCQESIFPSIHAATGDGEPEASEDEDMQESAVTSNGKSSRAARSSVKGQTAASSNSKSTTSKSNRR